MRNANVEHGRAIGRQMETSFRFLKESGEMERMRDMAIGMREGMDEADREIPPRQPRTNQERFEALFGES